MARRASRVDANQSEIANALRSAGASVHPTHMVADGFPDLAVGYRGANHLLEVKDGSKPPSKRKLTTPEQDFHAAWRGTVQIVNNVDEALAAVGIRTKEQA